MAEEFSLRAILEAEDRASDEIAKVGQATEEWQKQLESVGETADKTSQKVSDLGDAAKKSGEGADAAAERLDNLSKASNLAAEAQAKLIDALANVPRAVGNAVRSAERLVSAFGTDLSNAISATVKGIGSLVPGLGDLSDSSSKASQSVDQLSSRFVGSAKALGDFAIAARALQQAIAALGPGLRAAAASAGALVTAFAGIPAILGAAGLAAFGVVKAYRTLKTETNNLVAAEEALIRQQLRLQQAQEQAETADRAAEAYREWAASFLDLNERIEANAKLQRDAAARTENFRSAAAALGIALESNVNRQLEANAAFLAEAERQYKANELTLRDYLRVKDFVAESNQRAKDSLKAEVIALDEDTAATDRNTESKRRNAEATRDQAAAIREGQSIPAFDEEGRGPTQGFIPLDPRIPIIRQTPFNRRTANRSRVL